jgi:hypothetical protein
MQSRNSIMRQNSASAFPGEDKFAIYPSHGQTTGGRSRAASTTNTSDAVRECGKAL